MDESGTKSTSKSVLGKVPEPKSKRGRPAKPKEAAMRDRVLKQKYHRRLGGDHDLDGKPVHSKGASSAEMTVSSNIDSADSVAVEPAVESKGEEKPKPGKDAKFKWNEDKTQLIVADADTPQSPPPDAKGKVAGATGTTVQ